VYSEEELESTLAKLKKKTKASGQAKPAAKAPVRNRTKKAGADTDENKPTAPDNEEPGYVAVKDIGELRLIEEILKRLEKNQLNSGAIITAERQQNKTQTPLFTLRQGETAQEAYSIEEIVNKIKESGRKGITIQRYKGLGEMNPEQLWFTTMDPEHRMLLQVKIEDAARADEIFTVLMGDQVEPRRRFIQRHAPEVRNLDV